MDNAVVVFSVKDRDLFGISNQYVAECFISFEEIARGDKTEQKHLKLSRPTSSGENIFLIFFFRSSNNSIILSLFLIDYESIRALEYRQGDKLAKEFIKKFKQKLSTS